MLLENSGSEEKLNVQLAAQHALHTATSKSEAGTQLWTELPQGVGKETEVKQVLPFHLQDRTLNSKRQFRSHQCLQNCLGKGQRFSLDKTSYLRHTQDHQIREQKDCNPWF